MERKGTLTPERFGYSMPVDAPLYPRPPLHYQDAQFVVLTYETDADAAAAALPADLTAPPASAGNGDDGSLPNFLRGFLHRSDPADPVRMGSPLVAICLLRSSLSVELARAADRVGYPPDDAETYSTWNLAPTAN